MDEIRQAPSDEILKRFSAAATVGHWPAAITAGLELMPLLESLDPDIGFGVVSNMSAMSTKLCKQLHPPAGAMDVHLLRAFLYEEYAREFLAVRGAQMRDSQRAASYLDHEAEMNMSVGLKVLSSFSLPDRRSAALQAVRNLEAHERTRFEPQISRILRDEPEVVQAKKKGCFIATAAMGTPLAPEIRILSDFRDEVLVPTVLGRMFVQAYDHLSPPLARVIARSATLRAATRRIVVRPAVWWARRFGS